MNGAVERMKGIFMRNYSSAPLITLFITIMGVSLGITAVAFLIDPSLIKSTMNTGNFDPFTDHFDSVMYSIDHPYTVYKVIYPALITLFYQGIGIITEPFTDGSGSNLAYQMRDSLIPMLVFAIFMVLSALLVAIALYKTGNKHFTKKQLLAIIILLILSNPLIHVVERGNCLIACIGFCLLFILGYKSENRTVRLLAYLCLGIATGMKIFTAIFAMVILRERDYRGFAECFVIVCALLFIPFIFTDGSFAMMMDTILNFTEEHGRWHAINLSQMAYSLDGFLPDSVCQVLGRLWSGLLLLFTIIVVLFDRNLKQWQALFLISTNMIIGFSVPSSYMFVYLLIWVPYFLMAENKPTVYNLLLIVLIAVILSYAPIFGLCSLALLAFSVEMVARSIIRMKNGDVIPLRSEPLGH